MGLDMYLIKVPKGVDPMTRLNGETNDMVAYWRKANQIHGFFNEKLNGVNDCIFYKVTKDILTELLDKCDEVYMSVGSNGRVDPIIAARLLPTESGFFYGSTEYDNFYTDEIESTIEKLDKVILETDFENYDIYYYAWW